jgi:threonine/homoserine/homoserine lactone efflux protein
MRRAARALPGPLLSDGPIVAIVLLAVGRAPQGLLRGLAVAGGLFLAWLALQSGRELAQRRGGLDDAEEAEASAGRPRSVTLRAALVNGLGPGPWVFWGTVMGPLLVSHWRVAAPQAILFVAGFYGAFLATMAAQAALLAQTRRLGAKAVRGAGAVGVALLLVFAGTLWWFAWSPPDATSAPAADPGNAAQRKETP